ncbi:MAG: hypothetical protein P4L84_18545 [Isosphaeraceae bacterium]|nr:hypothetical protein [Isosphaeraceae bacterium]
MFPKKLLAVLSLLALVVGCSLNRTSSDVRPSSLITRIGGQSGQVIEPKRCLLTVVILARPLRDESINDVLWRGVDEQAVGPEARRALEENGLRVGLLTGGLPAEIDALVKAPPPNKVEPVKYILPDGEPALIRPVPAVPRASLFLSRHGQATGKEYKDAGGILRATTQYEGTTSVGVRLVPEIQHGPVQQSIGTISNGGLYAPQQYALKNGQQEETLRELTANLTLQPDQAIVVGCLPDHPRSLGAFLLTEPEPGSDRLLQKVVLMWALQGKSGTPGSGGTPPAGLQPVDPPKS